MKHLRNKNNEDMYKNYVEYSVSSLVFFAEGSRSHFIKIIEH
jgi:hypothetical protein